MLCIAQCKLDTHCIMHNAMHQTKWMQLDQIIFDIKVLFFTIFWSYRPFWSLSFNMQCLKGLTVRAFKICLDKKKKNLHPTY